MRLVLATRNAHKLHEVRSILAGAIKGFDPDLLVSAADFDLPEPVEDAATFAGNAFLKADQIARELGVPALADDSGLSVKIMGGAPGIFSARWSGKHGDDDANLDLLLAQLADVPEQYRGASFICAAALVTPDGRTFVREGNMPGTLRYERAGKNGFGYDPIFEPEGYTVTAAELEPSVKNAISHRHQAFTALAPVIAEFLD